MISETETSIPGMPGKHTLKDFNAFENHKAYDRAALQFDLVEPGDLVKVYSLGLDPSDHSKAREGIGMFKIVQRCESHTGIVLHTDLTNYFVTVLVDCEKLHFYYRSVKKL